MLDNLGRPGRVLLLGGTSEIGLAIIAALSAPADTEVLLAGRDEQRMAAAGKELPFRCLTISFDAAAPEAHKQVIAAAFAAGPVHPLIAPPHLPPPHAPLDNYPALSPP